MVEYEIREFQDGDERSLLATFNRVFADMPPRTPEQWSWAYRANPAGRRIFVALHDGAVVAQYAGMPNRARFEQRTGYLVDVVDSMVDPEHRMGLKRPGLFIKTAEPFLAACGAGGEDLALYGWPIEKAWPINKRFLGYREVRTESVLAREPGAGPLEAPPDVEQVERFAGADGLYERCRASWGLSTIRDDAFLNWRYATNPFHDYACLVVRSGPAELAGLAVYRAPGADMPETALLVDFLVPPDEVEAGRLLERAVLARARADRAAAIATVQLEWTPWFARFAEWGWTVWPSEWMMVASVFHPRLDPAWLRESWWYQMGDLDVV